MIALPTLPTENLNKFLALGGIVATLATMILYISEAQKAEISGIKLQSGYEVYNYKISLYNTNMARIKTQFINDSIYFKEKIKEAIILEKKDNAGDSQVVVYQNKQYSPTDFHSLMVYSYDKALNKYGEQTMKETRASEADDFNLIKLREQSSLIKANKKYMNIITGATVFVVLVSVLLSIYGFSQWYILQKISDNISRVQLEKSEKELADLRNKETDKRQIILP